VWKYLKPFSLSTLVALSNIPDTRMRINSAGQWRVVISDLKQGFIIIPTCLLLIALKKAYATFTSLTVTENIFYQLT